jgi:hypothetical protein
VAIRYLLDVLKLFHIGICDYEHVLKSFFNLKASITIWIRITTFIGLRIKRILLLYWLLETSISSQAILFLDFYNATTTNSMIYMRLILKETWITWREIAWQQKSLDVVIMGTFCLLSVKSHLSFFFLLWP